MDVATVDDLGGCLEAARSVEKPYEGVFRLDVSAEVGKLVKE